MARSTSTSTTSATPTETFSDLMSKFMVHSPSSDLTWKQKDTPAEYSFDATSFVSQQNAQILALICVSNSDIPLKFENTFAGGNCAFSQDSAHNPTQIETSGFSNGHFLFLKIIRKIIVYMPNVGYQISS